jgi:histidyl-tRNA synthetase
MERLVELLAQQEEVRGVRPQAYLVLLGEAAEKQGMTLAEQLRDNGIRIEFNCGAGGLKAQLKRADRSGARFALILGDEEVKIGSVAVKDLRQAESQESVTQAVLADYLKQKI